MREVPVMRILAIIFPFLFVTLPSIAFINIESVRQIPGEGFAGSSGFQFNGQDGNTQKFSSRASTLGVYRLPEDELLFLGEYRYGTSDNEIDTNRGQAHLRSTFQYHKSTAYEVFIQSEFDEFKDLNARHLAGANVRFRLLNDDRHIFYLGTGAFYEIEDFSLVEDQEGFRGNIYVSYSYKITELVSAAATTYYQPKLEDLEEYRVRFQSGLDIFVSKTLVFDVDFNLVHDTDLPEDVKPTDTDYLVGFTVKY